MKNSMLLGILGGLGPMSTVYFCELLTAHTKALADSDHIDMIVSSRASTPDRTAFILGKSDRDPLPVMIDEADRLVKAGADLIVIPCNTAHYFYNGLQAACKVPILNIIRGNGRASSFERCSNLWSARHRRNGTIQCLSCGLRSARSHLHNTHGRRTENYFGYYLRTDQAKPTRRPKRLSPGYQRLARKGLRKAGVGLYRALSAQKRGA